MNYYPFHLGDYASHTAHLDPMEDLAYRRMIDLYYLRESPLPECPKEVARLVRLKDHHDAVECVLREFFTLSDCGWSHERCDEEIAKMQDKQEKARASAMASVIARKEKAKRTFSVRSTDVELPTPIPTPIPIPIPEEKHKARSAKRAQQISPDFEPDETCKRLADELNVAIGQHLPKFIDYHTARGKPMKDWQACFRTWLRNAKEWQKPAQANAQKRSWIYDLMDEKKKETLDGNAKLVG